MRFALASETGNNRRFSEALIKRLTGGDKLTGAKLRGDLFSFSPSHKLWFQCNHLPAIKDATVGMWERVRVIPFNREFTGEQQDKQLKQKLIEEHEGIFAWAVEGARLYLEAGRVPPLPKSMQDAIEAYRNDNDVLRAFIAEKLIRSRDSKVGVQETFNAYLDWCHERGDDQPISIKFFRKNMGERDVASKEVHKQHYFFNVRLDRAANDNRPIDLSKVG